MIDLRSDTVTRPCDGMRKAMAQAEVGDDVFGEDPTVNSLQERLAEMFGAEAALFVPSGTMGNEICIKVHTQPGDEVVCESGCHIFNYESGAAAFLSGVQMRSIQGTRGAITREQVETAIQPPLYFLPKTTVIAVENTHNSAGGTVFPIDVLADLHMLAQERGLKLHLDGARIWNASAATGIPLQDYVGYCDSISVCFSKGLGAPIGSAIAGTKEFVQEAHRLRKLFGGGMRQVGILASAVLYALENNLSRLPEDHANARLLAERLAELPGIEVDLDTVQTNIVIFDIAESGRTVSELLEALKDAGVLVVPFGPTRLRAVTHLDVSREDVEFAAGIFSKIVRGTH